VPNTLAPLRSLTSAQKKSGLAAWLGWLFDGLDMHIYTLVAVPFVAILLKEAAVEDPSLVKEKSAIIQAAFLVGWALGGALFGRIGDRIGRSRALILTIITYAGFTGLSAVSTEWWHLLVFRFLSALGIGGEWAVGASLLAETWPKSWRPWIAATLQSAVNLGILLACFAGWLLADYSPRWIFVVGVLPALFTLWIRKEVPEPENWVAARGKTKPPGISELFGPAVRNMTWRTLMICAVSLTAHWTFMFWQQSHIRSLPEVRVLDASGQNHAVVVALVWIMAGSLIGNYLAGWLAQHLGYRRAITWMLAAYGLAMFLAFSHPLGHGATLAWFCVIGVCQGVFGLFTMCLPPLFPTLLRTTGAGFCYNIGRLFSAAGVVFFGFFVKVGDARVALFYAGLLFIPAAMAAMMLPERENDE
jgi:MFS family permease